MSQKCSAINFGFDMLKGKTANIPIYTQQKKVPGHF